MKKAPEIIDKAYSIAVNDLHSNYGKLGIYAGPRNHHEYWARDSFFASYGSLMLGDYEMVRKNLDLFIKFQNSNGQIPLRVEERYHGPGVLGLNIPHFNLRALYKPSQPWAGEVIDSNPLFLIAVSEYVIKTGDNAWVYDNKDAIMKAVSWIETKIDEKGLMKEGYNSGWADFTFKRGNVLYTNVITWKALELLCKALPPSESSYCLLLTKKLENNIANIFWSTKRGYYFDHIGIHGNMHKVFASDGNLLSVFFDLAPSKKGKRIMDFIDKHNLSKIPVPIYFKGLEWKHKIWNELLFSSYNTENTFTWWGSISAVCRMKLGQHKKAVEDLYNLSKIIVRYGTVPEIVDPKGNLVRTPIYRTELKCAWSAGMFVFAYHYAKANKILP